MKNKRLILAFSFLIIVLLFSIIAMKTKDITVTTSNETLSNVKIGWGIKRNDNHEQPDLGSNNKKLIDTTDTESVLFVALKNTLTSNQEI